MTLSEAIRLGSTLRPQAFGDLRKEVCVQGGKPVYGSCALGAAFEAGACREVPKISDGRGLAIRGGNNEPGGFTTIIPEQWYKIMQVTHHCPECGVVKALSMLIPHINDVHMWSRHEIADLVAGVEARESLRETQAINEEKEKRETAKLTRKPRAKRTGTV